MTYQEFEKKIEFFLQYINEDNPITYELTFFKIYVQFQKFIAEIFQFYCLGFTSESQYCPQRKLIFDDEEHLFKMLGIGGKRYIDFYDIAKNNSDLFFKDNPFKIMNEIAEYKTNINYMDAIRNYIAHESHESKQCYIKKCLFDGIFIEPYVFLLKKNGTLSYFSNFVNNIKNIAKSLIEKPLE